ncbi:MAG: cold-shock protein [Sulfobacillus benefaciens]|uniref:Cold-shock protein n=1 Tax=Sulfobacillus benefaciens TaxID=453960 RepID=A0A2T2X8D9_9FIRM|nr:MAG: cold-shock protein [Sulfobacillus benefaciens]
MPRRKGVVKWFKEEKGYGRIMLDGQDGHHVFVHFSAIRPNPRRFPNGYRFLKPGQKVTFHLIETNATDSQRLTAVDVEILSD